MHVNQCPVTTLLSIHVHWANDSKNNIMVLPTSKVTRKMERWGESFRPVSKPAEFLYTASLWQQSAGVYQVSLSSPLHKLSWTALHGLMYRLPAEHCTVRQMCKNSKNKDFYVAIKVCCGIVTLSNLYRSPYLTCPVVTPFNQTRWCDRGANFCREMSQRTLGLEVLNLRVMSAPYPQTWLQTQERHMAVR